MRNGESASPRGSMVDIHGTGTTVAPMSTDSILVLLGGLAVLVGSVLGGQALRRKRDRKSAGNAATRQSSGATDAGVPGENDAATAKRDPRIDRVAEAYANGEIDERMLTTAAHTLGISKDEARQRLAGAAETRGTAGTDDREKKRAQARAKNRKKNKQAKRSRQANRR